MQFIVKLFPEITIKSRPVRNRMVAKLRGNLLKLLRGLDPQIQVRQRWDHIQLETTTDDNELIQTIIATLQCTPGISNFLQVETSQWQGMEDAFEKVRLHFGEQLHGKTFAVRCKRTGDHDFRSADVEYEVGGRVKNHCQTAGVNLDNPDVLVRLELRQDQLSIVLKRFEGLGGYPLGSQDAVLSLVSGGFDSTVASYLTMKRGLLTHFCFFNLGGRAHEIGVKEVAAYLWMKYGASHSVKFVSISFEDVVREILEKIDNAQMGVVLKRMMLRAATQVAQQLSIPALVTGESVAQVSSQTLQNLSVIDSVTSSLVLRPLVTSDKTDIIRIAREIGTEAFAESMPEYCGVISKKPTTHAKPDKIAQEEEQFDFAILQHAIDNADVVSIQHIAQHESDNEAVEIVTEPAEDETVVDIRHPDEAERHPLKISNRTVIQLPFYALHGKIQSLDGEKNWLLYCDKGVLSQLHAQHLKDDGFKNVKVYRPD